VRRTGIGCAYKRCLRIETEPGKGSEDEGESASKSEGRDVFQEDETGSNVANNSSDVVPDPADVGDAPAGASGGPGLTRETGRDNIHVSTPASAIEGDQVIPDRRRSQDTFRHARCKDRSGITFPLDVTPSAEVGEHQLESKLESADAGAQRESSEGTRSHPIHAPSGLRMK
jgi:hypothetical protein